MGGGLMTTYFYCAEFIDPETKLYIFGVNGFVDTDGVITNSKNGQEVLAKIKQDCIDRFASKTDPATYPIKATFKIVSFSRIN